MGGSVCLQYFIQYGLNDPQHSLLFWSITMGTVLFPLLGKSWWSEKALSIGHFCLQFILPLYLLKHFLISFKCTFFLPGVGLHSDILPSLFILPLFYLIFPSEIDCWNWRPWGFYQQNGSVNITPFNVSPLNKQMATSLLHLDSMGVLKLGSTQLYKEKWMVAENKGQNTGETVIYLNRN